MWLTIDKTVNSNYYYYYYYYGRHQYHHRNRHYYYHYTTDKQFIHEHLGTDDVQTLDRMFISRTILYITLQWCICVTTFLVC